MPNEERAVYEVIASHVAAALGRGAVPLAFKIPCRLPSGAVVELLLDPARMPQEAAGAAPRRTVAEAVVATLGAAERPLKGAALARRAGLAGNSYFRQTLSALRAAGVLRKEEDGYVLAGKLKAH